MLIDWFTVGAQVLNFVVLIALMKRFLYQPVLDAIAAREKRIAGQIADAATKQAQAATEREAFANKNLAFDQQRAGLLEKANADATAEGHRLADAAREAAAALTAQRQQALATQAEQLQHLIADRAAREVFAIARKTLTDLANAGLEEHMVEVFTQRLAELNDTARDTLGAALTQNAEPALVRSHFVLPAQQQTTIRNAINVTFSADVPLRFEPAADAVCGIELSAGGQKVSWTIAEYLHDLEQNVAALLAPATKPTAARENAETAPRDTASTPHTKPVSA